MTDTTENTGNYAGPSRGPIDWLWLGGVALTNTAVWLLFGAKYIGLALTAYCFVFVLTMRKQIKSAYPAEMDKTYEISWPLYEKDHIIQYIRRTTHERFFTWFFVWYFSACALSQLLFFICVVTGIGFEVIPSLLVFVFCNGFLLFRYHNFFTICCGGIRRYFATTVWSPNLDWAHETDKRWNHSEEDDNKVRNCEFSMSRMCAGTGLFVLVWCGLLFAYVMDQLGGESVFGVAIERTFISTIVMWPIALLPVALHLLLFQNLTNVLRGWGDES